MCSRYNLEDFMEDAALTAYLQQAQDRAWRGNIPMVQRGQIAPTNIVPVIAPGAITREPGAFPMRWGFIHPMHKVLVFNTRSETAQQKPLFCTSIADRRCLIPAACYFEWAKAGKRKIKYAFSAENGGPLYLAGLYLRSSRSVLPCFTILTREAAGATKSIHGRMPLVLPQQKIHAWLSPECAYETLLESAVTNLVMKAC